MLWRSLVKDSAIYGGADIATKTIAVLTFPLIAAVLGPSDFGALELVVTATTLLGLIANCGLSNAVQRYYWDEETDEDQRPTLVSSGLYTLLANTFLSVLVGVAVVLILVPYLRQSEFPIGFGGLIAALILMSLNQAGQYFLDVTRLHFSPWRFLLVSVTTRVLVSLAGLLAIVVWRWSLDAMLALQAFVVAISLPLAIWVVRRDIVLSFDRAVSGMLLKFGYPFIAAVIAFWLFGAMDRWMLAAMTSVEDVGLYAVAHRFASIVMFFSIAFGQAWSPFAMKLRLDQPDRYRDAYSKVLLALFFGMLAVAGSVAVFSGEIFSIFMPEEYAGAALAFAVLSLGVVLQSTQQVTAVGISLEKKTYLFGRLSWLSVAVNFGLNIFLIPRFGVVGAAWATTASYWVLTVSYMYFTQKLHPLPIVWRSIGVLCAAWLIITVLASTSLTHGFEAQTVVVKIVSLILVCGAVSLMIPWLKFKNVA